jgi:hypothetical protein
MDSKEFKMLFNEVAEINGFGKEFGGWIKESTECISVLDLQKSKLGDYYQLMIKVYIHGLWGTTYTKDKRLLKDIGDIFRSTPLEYNSIFKLDISMSREDRKKGLEKLFSVFLVPFVNEALSKDGIKRLEQNGTINLLPAVENEIRKFI